MGQRALVRIPCTTGINQASPIDGGGFDACQNFRSDGNGRALVKRKGLVRYTADVRDEATTLIKGDGATSIVENCSMLAHAGNYNLIGTSYGWIHAMDDTDADDSFFHVGRHSTARPIRRDRAFIASTLGGGSNYDFGYGDYPPSVAVSGSDYTLVAAITSEQDCKLVLYNADRIVVWQYLIALGAQPRVKVLPSATGFLLITSEGTAINLYSILVNQFPSYGSITVGSATQVATLNAAGNSWDAVTAGSAGWGVWWLAYQSSATEGTIEKFIGTTSSSSDTFSTGGIDEFSVQFVNLSTARIFVGWYDVSAVEANYLVYSIGAISQVLASTQISTFTGYDEGGPPLFGVARDPLTGASNSTTAFWVLRARNTSGDSTNGWACICGTADTSGTVSAAAGTDIFNALPVSKPDDYGRFWVMLGSYADETLLRHALIRVPDPNIQQPVTVELLAERSLATDVATYGPVADIAWHHSVAQGSDFSAFCLMFCVAEYGTLPLFAFDVMFYECSEHDPHVNVVQTGNTVVTSGQPVEVTTYPYQVEELSAGGVMLHDGAAEVGWAMRPTIAASSQTAAPSSIAIGSYKYVVVAEYIDIYGRRHLSEPSAPHSVTIAAVNRAVTLRVSVPGVTQRNVDPSSFQARPNLILYRTEDGGTTYYKVPSDPRRFPFESVVVSFGDTAADADIITQETLYTSGAKPNDAAPSCRYLAKVDDRLWCGGLWDPTILQCSKFIVPNEPINFVDDDAFRVQLSAPCTGLAGMNGSLVAFTASTIEVVSGEGPDDRGAGYFSPPETISSTIGCSNDRSIVTTDIGIIFQNSAGFFLLPRGFGQVQPLGEAIRDLALGGDASYCWASASFVGTDQVAAWLVSTDSGTLPSKMLVFDIAHNQWFLDVLDGGTYRELGAWSTGLALCTSSLDSDTVSTPIAVQRFNSADTTDDGSTFLDAKISTDTIHPFGVGGQGNVYAVMVVFSGGNFTLHIDIKTDTNAQQQASFTIASNTNANNYRAVMPAFPRCSTVQIDVYDAENSGADLSFSPLAIVIGVEPDDGDMRYLAEGERA